MQSTPLMQDDSMRVKIGTEQIRVSGQGSVCASITCRNLARNIFSSPDGSRKDTSHLSSEIAVAAVLERDRRRRRWEDGSESRILAHASNMQYADAVPWLFLVFYIIKYDQ